MILAIDGGKRIGWALFTEQGQEVDRGVISYDTFFSEGDYPFYLSGRGTLWFSDMEITILVVEGFRHDPRVAQGGSLHWASQVEGAVKLLGKVAYLPVEVQYSSILPVAMTYAKYDPPKTKTGNKKHLPDEDSAYLHGMYYAVTHGLRDPVGVG